jgi:bacteriorhodopsin
MRYLDWFMTTPLLLLSLTLYFDYENKKYDPTYPGVSFSQLGWIILLDLIMLTFGYLGETGRISKIQGFIFGTIPLIIMYYIIWKSYVKSPNSKI